VVGAERAPDSSTKDVGPPGAGFAGGVMRVDDLHLRREHRKQRHRLRLGAQGNAAPVRIVSGRKTRLRNSDAVALDAGRNVYVSNYRGSPSGNGTVTVYAAGAIGDAPPIRTIGGSNTGLAVPQGVSLDTSGNIYVANPNACPPVCSGGNALVYAAGANGNVAPTRTIGGSNTGLDAPLSIALDERARIYIANWKGNSVTVYAAGANGDVRPIQSIKGSNTGLSGPVGVVVDASRNIYVANPGTNGVLVYAAGAEGNVAPIAAISGSNTGLHSPFGIALDTRRNIYVANSGDNNLLIFAAGANGNIAPIRTISGPKTKLDGPFGIALR
jgi:hypothetical protein